MIDEDLAEEEPKFHLLPPSPEEQKELEESKFHVRMLWRAMNNRRGPGIGRCARCKHSVLNHNHGPHVRQICRGSKTSPCSCAGFRLA